MPKKKITWKKCDGRYICAAKECGQWTENGCLLRKVGLTCDNGECEFNVSPMPGVYQCGCMDVHLDADGKCLGFRDKEQVKWERQVDAECDHYFDRD